jgi:magnesium and cobalt transporter
MISERPDGTLDVDGRLPIEEFETRLGMERTESEREADIDTVGGLVANLAGRMPARGEILTHDSGLEFRILDADGRRIRRVRVTKTNANKAVAA